MVFFEARLGAQTVRPLGHAEWSAVMRRWRRRFASRPLGRPSGAPNARGPHFFLFFFNRLRFFEFLLLERVTISFVVCMSEYFCGQYFADDASVFR